MKHFYIFFLTAIFAISCDCRDETENDSKKALSSLEAEITELESKIADLEAKKAQEDKCRSQLNLCRQNLAKCEKDPFTGTKYLLEEDD